jgi:hypothetical protein
MKPVPLQPNLPTPTTAFGTPQPIAQYYECPHCHKQSPLVREWVGLTEEEVEDLYFDEFSMGQLKAFGRELEAKLKRKNCA